MPEVPPLVSVIVRTTGRPSLSESVESVVRQTYRPIEVIVVNAGATNLPPIPAATDLDTQVIEGGPYNRPRAANVGLSAARGRWIAFLDDDDIFLPHHIESLVREVHASDGALVAYSATQCVDEKGRTEVNIEMEFDRLKLFAANYIQIGAALFSSILVAEGYRFDEGFECLQDWDFWIQLAQRTHFAYTALITNQWRAFSGASGCGMGQNFDGRRIGRFKQLLMQKWSPIRAALQRKVDHHNQVAHAAMRQGLPDKADAHMAIAERLLRGPARPAASPRRHRAVREIARNL
jgi:Glycosyl transferase family 2